MLLLSAGVSVAITDSDGDGIADDVDNCPQVSNPDQKDSDTDGIGDVCDNCNPIYEGTAYCTTALSTRDCSTCWSDSYHPNYWLCLQLVLQGNLGEIDWFCVYCCDPPNAPPPTQCTIGYYDTDNDGVGGLCDSCPDTPAGETVNIFGCSATCYDTDGGQVSTVFGSVYPNGSPIDAIKDSCVDTTHVKEYYCNAGAVSSVTLACAPGSLCYEGACRPDSDNDGFVDEIDNCPTTPNPSHADQDKDKKGDACDNCRNVPNWDQLDFDGDCASFTTPYSSDPHCGDACDNCLLVSNPNQADNDSDGVGNACDNCWETPNKDQNDKDGDCAGALPPYFEDNHCGDACDNCPSHYNPKQEDWDKNGVGDLCDCNDNLMGPNEEGADCGYFCSKACPLHCVPILSNGGTNGKIDIVFIRASGYEGGWQKFVDDTREAIFTGYFQDSIISANGKKINFWYSTEVAPFTDPGINTQCVWQEPSNWRQTCPQGALGVILNRATCRDSASPTTGVFSARTECPREFIHELGHSLFGLQDEYGTDCTAYQKCPGKYCNIFKDQDSCISGSTNPSKCTKFTNCGWWKSQPSYTIMGAWCAFNDSCGLCTWGPDAERAVIEEFTTYVDPPEDETRKAIVGYFSYDGSNIEMYDAAIVYGDSPERYLNWDKFRMVFLNSNEEVVNEFTIGDPRFIEIFDPLEAVLKDTVEFSLVFPFEDNIKTLQVYDIPAMELLATIDLSAAVSGFCSENPNDPQCLSYDWDGDGIPDIQDNCPGIPNPDQGDRDGDGKGNVCDEMVVPMDVKPQSCPNPLIRTDRSLLPVAILGSAGYSVTEIDPKSIRLEGIAPVRYARLDVATPFIPFVGKVKSTDCNTAGPDGILDLTLKFNNTSIVSALGSITNKEVRLLNLTGKLYDGTPIVGEDVVVILKK